MRATVEHRLAGFFPSARDIEMAQRKKMGEGKRDTKGKTVREEKFARLRRKATPLVFPKGFPLRKKT